MVSEDFFIRGYTDDMPFVILRKQKDSNYFYYPTEHLVKPNDIEPVTLTSLQDFSLALTRIHYWGLAVWINPLIAQMNGCGKPVITFTWNVHTPIICMPPLAYNTPKGYDVHGIGFRFGWNGLQWAIGKGSWEAEVEDKAFLNSTFNDLKEYPAIVREEKANAIRNAKQRFDKQSVLTNTKRVYLVGDGRHISALEKILLGGQNVLTTSQLGKFLDLIMP